MKTAISGQHIYKQILETPMLTDHEEQELYARIEENDGSARMELVNGYLPLAYSLAKKYIIPGLSFDDLYQTAAEGLIHAAGTFDPAQGLKFSTYALTVMSRAVWGEMNRNSRSVRLPAQIRKRLAEYNRFSESFFMENGRTPIDEEAANALFLSTEDIQVLRIAGQPELSLDQPIAEDGEDDELTLLDVTPGEGDFTDGIAEESERAETIREVRKCVNDLPEEERDVISGLYFAGLTASALAEKRGKTVSEVRKAHRKGLNHLQRSPLRRLRAREYFISSHAYRSSWRAWKEHFETSSTEYTVLKLIERGL